MAGVELGQVCIDAVDSVLKTANSPTSFILNVLHRLQHAAHLGHHFLGGGEGETEVRKEGRKEGETEGRREGETEGRREGETERRKEGRRKGGREKGGGGNKR